MPMLSQPRIRAPCHRSELSRTPIPSHVPVWFLVQTLNPGTAAPAYSPSPPSILFFISASSAESALIRS